MPQQIELAVTGMHCAGCQQRATQAVTRPHGVPGAMASHGSGVGRVSYDPDQLQPPLIAERLEAAGFGVTGFTVADGEARR